MNESRSAPAAFEQLEPEAVLQALDAVGFRGDGRLLQLNSYENRVFQVFLEEGSADIPAVVAKFYRAGRWSSEQILEEHAFARELMEAEVPVVAPLVLAAGGSSLGAEAADSHARGSETRSSIMQEAQLSPTTGSSDPARDQHLQLLGSPSTLAVLKHDDHSHAPWRYAVSPRHAGRHPELEDATTLRWLGRFLGRLHAVGRTRRFKHRRTLSVQTMGRQPYERIKALDVVPEAQWGAWSDACTQALDLLDEAWARRGLVEELRIHGDCHPGNILWRDEGPHVVDLDDACMGPAVQDLWMMLSGNHADAQWQLECLLEGYRQFSEFDLRDLELIEPLRTLRMIHHSAWIAERWTDPAFPAAFAWFGTAGYWSQQTAQLQEQMTLMREGPALAVIWTEY